MLEVKSIDAGFGDKWYSVSAPVGDILDAPQTYSRNGTARRCVDIIANTSTRVAVQVWRGEKELDLLPENFAETLNAMTTDAIVFGAWYFLPERIGGRLRLTRLLPSTVRYVYERGELVRFERSTAQGIERYAPDDLVWWWEQNLESEQGPGQSMLFAALTDATFVPNSDPNSRLSHSLSSLGL